MNFGFLTESKINRRQFASVMLLNIGALSWFFIFMSNMEGIFGSFTYNSKYYSSYVGNAIVYGSTILWSIAITFIGNRLDRRKLLFTSIILGILSTVLLAFTKGPIFTSIVASLSGMSLGLFLPSSMALVADNTIAENRGRVSGIIILATFIVAFAFMVFHRILGLDLSGLILIMAIVRSISLIGLFIGRVSRPSIIGQRKSPILPSIYKEFIFYLLPFVLFTFASAFAASLIEAWVIERSFEEMEFWGENLRYGFIAMFGLASGFIADRFGRKQPIYFGLLSMGIGYIFLVDVNILSINVFYILSGITWGLFFVVFLAVPGDLSPHFSREKFYLLGYILPVTSLFGLSAIPVIHFGDILKIPLIVQIVGVFLFLSMYPIFRAKETLAESKIQERKMKEYVESVGKIIQETEEEK